MAHRENRAVGLLIIAVDHAEPAEVRDGERIARVIVGQNFPFFAFSVSDLHSCEIS